MKIKTLALFCLLAFLAPRAALAADTPPAGPALKSLISSGYEVKAIVDISDAEQKYLWPNDSNYPYLMLTLQKSGSIATCTISMSDWVNGDLGTGRCKFVGGS